MLSKSFENKLVLGIPKGSLQDSTVEMFQRAGFRLNLSSRSYFPGIDDDRMAVIMFRAQEMSRYVEDGVLDVGITGSDWIVENGSQVVEVAELVYSKQTSQPARWVLAVPEESTVRQAEELAGGIIATELVNGTKKYFAAKGVNVKVEFSWGATEVKARLVDAIVDVTETGSSLRANRMRIIETVMTSRTQFIANSDSWADKWKQEKIESLSILFQGALAARFKVGLKMNVSSDKLDAVLAVLPAMKKPTLSNLANDAGHAVEVIVDESVVRQIIPNLRRAGAEAIVEYPLNKLIP